MKSKILIPLLVTGALVAFFSFKYIGDGKEGNGNRHDEIISRIMRAIQAEHFSPRKVDDSFSVHIYNKVLDQLDGDKKFFIAADIAELSKDKFKLDDQIRDGKITFFDILNTRFVASIDRAEKMSKEALANPFTFTGSEVVQLDGEHLPWAANEAALKQRWRETIKYRVLAKYVDLKKARDNPRDTSETGADNSAPVSKNKTDAELEAEARESVSKSQDNYFKRWRKLDDEKRFALFANAITSSEDPHTDYFPPEDKKRFDESMSGSFYGIGASLKDEDGKIKIVAIIAGSPSWKQGELKAGDEIIRVGQGKNPPDDITGMDIDGVIKKIRGPKGSEVRITVKKIDGSTKTVPIVRDEVLIEETFAKSAIINSAGGPVGYIYLPEFYADFNHINGRRCATDVAVEVEKLKKAGVTGIILDLRYNGGGSLSDVVEMAGLFIDQGPMVQVKSTNSAPVPLPDNDKGTLYDGPMAIMVNQGSASASEIMAAAMQDYKRAVIVGGPTYGKGTVQKVLPLDDQDALSRMFGGQQAETGGIGALKITMQKFYRISGGSTQLRGVTPDILLPDQYRYVEIGERSDKSALKWDEIPASSYQPAPNPVNVASLLAASRQRVTANRTFTIIDQTARKLKDRQDNDRYSLNEATYTRELDENNIASKEIDELGKKQKLMTMTNPQEDLQRINRDEGTKTKNAEWLKNLSKDIYIAETVNIINDMSRGKLGSTMSPR